MATTTSRQETGRPEGPGHKQKDGPALIEHFDGRKWTATQQPFNGWQQNVTALAQVNRGPNTYRASGTGITVVGMSTANSAYVGTLAEHICPGQQPTSPQADIGGGHPWPPPMSR